ncbi:flagellar biosynthetic protein FliR [Halovulum sp. GXIMD14793]
MLDVFDQIAPLLNFSQSALVAAVLVFVRVGAIVSLAPGFGEQFIPVRVRLSIAICFAVIVWPLLDHSALSGPWTALRFGQMILGEAAIGVLIGLSLRLMVMALQLAGAIAAQTTALAQTAGAGVMPEPMPAIGNVLLLAGLALAMVLDLHIKLIGAVVTTYEIVGFGGGMTGPDIAQWGVAHAMQAFALGFTLAGSFLIAAFLYNVALGAINKAMPQLMVAFVGAPAITFATLVLLLLAAPVILTVWSDHLDALLTNPLMVPK